MRVRAPRTLAVERRHLLRLFARLPGRQQVVLVRARPRRLGSNALLADLPNATHVKDELARVGVAQLREAREKVLVVERRRDGQNRRLALSEHRHNRLFPKVV